MKLVYLVIGVSLELGFCQSIQDASLDLQTSFSLQGRALDASYPSLRKRKQEQQEQPRYITNEENRRMVLNIFGPEARARRNREFEEQRRQGTAPEPHPMFQRFNLPSEERAATTRVPGRDRERSISPASFRSRLTQATIQRPGRGIGPGQGAGRGAGREAGRGAGRGGGRRSS